MDGKGGHSSFETDAAHLFFQVLGNHKVKLPTGTLCLMSPRTKIRFLLWMFVAGLILAGATAIPLRNEIDWLVHACGADVRPHQSWLTNWLLTVQSGIHRSPPFLFYGTDWLAFGHFVIALAFLGPIRDPAKNIWVVQFGLIASLLVIPYALVFGALRGIPFPWRLIDCSFGVAGLTCLWPCERMISRLAAGID